MEPSGGEKEVTCPLCGDFEGTQRQVEGHVSGSGDSDHKGVLGRDIREEIAAVGDRSAGSEETGLGLSLETATVEESEDGESQMGEGSDSSGDDSGGGLPTVPVLVLGVLIVLAFLAKMNADEIEDAVDGDDDGELLQEDRGSPRAVGGGVQ